MTEEEIKAFKEKVAVLEDWIKDHETLPENIGKSFYQEILRISFKLLKKYRKYSGEKIFAFSLWRPVQD